MAKAKLSLTLLEMESNLGYKVDSLTHHIESFNRFYSDLRPVPSSIYQRAKDEFEEYEKKKHTENDDTISEKGPPVLDIVKTLVHGADTISLTCRSHIAFHNFIMDIHYGFGLDLALLLTSDEAFRVMSVANLQPNTTCTVTPTFFKIPTEIREMIYLFTIPKGKWKIGDMKSYDKFDMFRGIGDPRGFYFPLSKELTVLRVDSRMRQEALPLAYRKTVFHLTDMDDLIKLLIAVGEIGRNNIESLEFSWESGADTEWKWETSPDSLGLLPTLPTLHAAKCVQLLKQCKRLKYLRLYFESDLIINISPESFKADPGICELCSIRGIKRVEIWDLTCRSLEEQGGLARWLKGEMESQKEEEKGCLARPIATI